MVSHYVENQRSMNNLECLETFFSADAAEQERDFIEDVFITSESFLDIITPKMRMISILIGNKGSGKSALLEYVQIKATEQKIPVIHLTPADFKGLSFQEYCAPATVIQSVYDSILRSMAVKVGSQLHGLLSNEQDKLLKEAINSGAQEESTFDGILRVLLPIGKAVTNIDFEKMLPTHAPTTSSRQRGIVNYIKETEKKVFYVLLDDVDQIASAQRPDYYDVIWGEILALLKIAESMENVFPIIAIRQEIWRKLIVDNGNRDKLDHVRSMTNFLAHSRNDLRKIVERRLKVCIEKYNLPNEGVYTPFFKDIDCRLPNTNNRQYWSSYLITTSRENPRDIVYLVRMLIKSAKENGRQKIADDDVQAIAYEYSKSRVDDLVNQNKGVFQNIEAYIRSFEKTDFELRADALKKHLTLSLGMGNTIIEGKTIKGEDGFIPIWQILYNIGFIYARDIDNTKTENYKFIPYDKTLVSLVRWNDMQRYTWDVQPCYRPFLIRLKEEAKQRLLLSEDKKSSKGRSTCKERRNRKKKR